MSDDGPTASAIQLFSHLSPRTSGPLPDRDATEIPHPTSSISHSLPTAANPTYQSPEAPQTSPHLSILKSAEILSSVTVKIGETPVSDPLQFIHSVHFDIDLFKSIFKHACDCKDLVQCSGETIIIENVFHKCNLRKHAWPLTELACTVSQMIWKFCKNSLALPPPKLISCSVQYTTRPYIALSRTMSCLIHTSTVSITQCDRTILKITKNQCTGWGPWRDIVLFRGLCSNIFLQNGYIIKKHHLRRPYRTGCLSQLFCNIM